MTVRKFLHNFEEYFCVWIMAVMTVLVFFQVVNLPVEFNASSRAKEQLATLGIVGSGDMTYVRKVLNAAALTYVAATLQAILTLLYYVMLVSGMRRSD